jgi:hypothetical protein
MFGYKMPEGAEEVTVEEMKKHLDGKKKYQERRIFIDNPKNQEEVNAFANSVMNEVTEKFAKFGFNPHEVIMIFRQSIDSIHEFANPELAKLQKELYENLKELLTDE